MWVERVEISVITHSVCLVTYFGAQKELAEPLSATHGPHMEPRGPATGPSVAQLSPMRPQVALWDLLP